jgi:hypothetical protein
MYLETKPRRSNLVFSWLLIINLHCVDHDSYNHSMPIGGMFSLSGDSMNKSSVYHYHCDYRSLDVDTKQITDGTRSIIGAVIPSSQIVPTLPAPPVPIAGSDGKGAPAATTNGDDQKRGGGAAPLAPTLNSRTADGLRWSMTTARTKTLLKRPAPDHIGGNNGIMWCGTLADGQSTIIKLGVENDGKTKRASMELPRIDLTRADGKVVSARCYLPTGTVFSLPSHSVTEFCWL